MYVIVKQDGDNASMISNYFQESLYLPKGTKVALQFAEINYEFGPHIIALDEDFTIYLYHGPRIPSMGTQFKFSLVDNNSLVAQALAMQQTMQRSGAVSHPFKVTIPQSSYSATAFALLLQTKINEADPHVGFQSTTVTYNSNDLTFVIDFVQSEAKQFLIGPDPTDGVWLSNPFEPGTETYNDRYTWNNDGTFGPHEGIRTDGHGANQTLLKNALSPFAGVFHCEIPLLHYENDDEDAYKLFVGLHVGLVRGVNNMQQYAGDPNNIAYLKQHFNNPFDTGYQHRNRECVLLNWNPYTPTLSSNNDVPGFTSRPIAFTNYDIRYYPSNRNFFDYGVSALPSYHRGRYLGLKLCFTRCVISSVESERQNASRLWSVLPVPWKYADGQDVEDDMFKFTSTIDVKFTLNNNIVNVRVESFDTENHAITAEYDYDRIWVPNPTMIPFVTFEGQMPNNLTLFNVDAIPSVSDDSIAEQQADSQLRWQQLGITEISRSSISIYRDDGSGDPSKQLINKLPIFNNFWRNWIPNLHNVDSGLDANGKMLTSTVIISGEGSEAAQQYLALRIALNDLPNPNGTILNFQDVLQKGEIGITPSPEYTIYLPKRHVPAIGTLFPRLRNLPVHTMNGAISGRSQIIGALHSEDPFTMFFQPENLLYLPLEMASDMVINQLQMDFVDVDETSSHHIRKMKPGSIVCLHFKEPCNCAEG